jgi:hypothetical protein
LRRVNLKDYTLKLMNNTTQYNNTEPAKSTAPALEELDYYPINDLTLPPFNHTLLTLAQFLTETGTRREISETRLSQLTIKYCNQLHIRCFTAKEIREQLWGISGEIRGGGVRVEWFETSTNYGRFQAHYDFTFSRILRPEDYKKPEPQHERDRT